MMRTFHNLNEVPPGGFKYFCPHNGKWSQQFNSVREMMAHLRKFYADNGWKDAPEEEQVLDQLCRLLELNGSGECCTGATANPTVKEGRIAVTFNAIAQGTKVYADWIKSTQKVSLVEAERRAAICAVCPWNVKSNECSSCRGLSRFAQMVGDVAKFLGGLPNTSQDAKLHTCAPCLCAVKVKVHCPKDIILDNITEEQKGKLWSKCWIL